MKNLWYRFIVWVAPYITKALSSVHIPYSRKRMESGTYLEAVELARPGDVLLTCTFGELSGMFIPGKYTHVGWYLGNERVLEASTGGVKISHLAEFILRKDGLAVLRAKFATEAQMFEAATLGAALEGSDYDFAMNTQNDDWYCSEIVYLKTRDVLVAAGLEMPFTMRLRLGVETIAPDDFWQARSKWDLILESP